MERLAQGIRSIKGTTTIVLIHKNQKPNEMIATRLTLGGERIEETYDVITPEEDLYT